MPVPPAVTNPLVVTMVAPAPEFWEMTAFAEPVPSTMLSVRVWPPLAVEWLMASRPTSPVKVPVEVTVSGPGPFCCAIIAEPVFGAVTFAADTVR